MIRLAGILVAALCPLYGAAIEAQIRGEIERVEQSFKNRPITDKQLQGFSEAVEGSLKDARAALSAGRVYSSLEKLGEAENLLQGLVRASEMPRVEKEGLPAFESEWRATEVQIQRLTREVREAGSRPGPAALRAIAETSIVKATPLLEGGRGFAVSTKPEHGLFYLGLAQGEAEFAKFCASLPAARAGRAVAARLMLPELGEIQQRTNAAFQPPKSIEQHPRFIALNASIKLARELDAAKMYDGALFQYLEAERQYAMLSAPELDEASKKALVSDVGALKKRLTASKDDESIAEIFIERAEAHTSRPDGPADEWRSARVIVDRVIPAYFAARKSTRTIAAALGKTVNLTLVR